MRQPLRTKGLVHGATSGSQSYPAPVGGWNARDALAAMKPTDAITLENWFPRPSYVEIRGGSADHATGMTGPGKTLAAYYPLTGVGQMYCFTSSGIYNVTSAGAVGASKLARTDGKHQWVNFGDGTNNYLIACNGVDKPAYYDGTTWTAVDNASSPALTGVTSTTLVAPCVFKGRLFFIQKDTLSFWYLAAGAAGGALTEFPLDAEASKGGYLMAMAVWTIDAGDGVDDRLVLVTSEGQVIIYQGTNPASAAAWEKVGTYDLGKPLGRRCMCQYGGDLIIITENGAFPMSAALQSANIDYKLALSFKIESAFTTAAESYGSTFGWKATVYPAQSALIVNVPIAENGEHEQYVMNTITKAWCNFTEWDAEDFIVFDKQLYFTTSTKVVKAWTGFADGSSDVVAYGKSAFSYFGNPGVQKRFTMFRPVLAVNGRLSYLTDIDVDFKDTILVGTATYTPDVGGLWGTALWGTGLWGSGQQIVQQWTSPAEYPGRCAAGKLKVANDSLTIQWMACEYIYEYGGPVG